MLSMERPSEKDVEAQIQELATKLHRETSTIRLKALTRGLKEIKLRSSRVWQVEQIVCPLLLIAVSLMFLDLVMSFVCLFFVFFVIALLFVFRKYDSQLLIGTAVLLLTVSAVELAWGSATYANTLMEWAIYFLMLGLLVSFAEYVREEILGRLGVKECHK